MSQEPAPSPDAGSGEQRRAGRVRRVLAVLTPFAFFAVQWAVWPYVEPLVWTFLYPAVFVSAWLGGVAAGLRATVISAALVWLLLFWPSVTDGHSEPPAHFVSTAVFLGTGVLFSFLHGELRKATQRTLESLREREALHQQVRLQATVTAHLGGGVVLLRMADATIVYTNPRFEAMFGYEPGELIGRHVSVINAPGELDPRQRADQIIGELLRDDEWEGEVENIRKDGVHFWTAANVTTFDHPEHGRVWLSVHTDVTERKRLEEANLASLREKEMLLKEVHHRVKNNLQVVSSLFYLQRERVQDEQIRTLLDESRARVQSIALIHEQLYQSTSLAAIDFEAYLRRLIATMLSTRDAGPIEIEIQAAGVVLDIERAVPCGLLAGELVSNAFKHAFPERPGKVWVRAHPEGERQIVFEVADDGVGIPEGFDWQHASSLGLRLVQSLARQLRGTLELDRSRGTRFVVRFDAVSR